MSDRMFVTQIRGYNQVSTGEYVPPRDIEPRKRVYSFAEAARMIEPGEEAIIQVRSEEGVCFPDGLFVCYRLVGIDAEKPDNYWYSRPLVDY